MKAKNKTNNHHVHQSDSHTDSQSVNQSIRQIPVVLYDEQHIVCGIRGPVSQAVSQSDQSVSQSLSVDQLSRYLFRTEHVLAVGQSSQFTVQRSRFTEETYKFRERENRDDRFASLLLANLGNESEK